MEKILDLHVHTNCSDGVLSPKEVVDLAIKNGACAISITDHDTITAYSDELFDYAENRNLILIPGVEISTKWNKCGIHVLGYNFDINEKNLREELNKLRNSRHNYLYDVSSKIKELGYVIDVDKLDKIEVVTKADIALDVISNVVNKDLLLNFFGHIPGKGEFIETLLNYGCPAYVEKYTVSPRRAVEVIENAGGKAILAHPVAYKYEDNLSDEDILAIINDIGVKGIEANYHYVDKCNNRIEESSYWKNFAKSHNLLCSVGSDFHLDDGIHPSIGFKNWDIEFSREDAYIILDYLSN